jgi:hypothetical protein
MTTSKYIEIKVPKTLGDLRIEHLKALQFSNEKLGKMKMQDIIEFLSLVTSATKNELRKINLEDLKDILEHVVKIFTDYKVKNPDKKINIEGKDYEIIDPKKVGVGWHIDISNSDFEKDPGRLASLMYIEKGSTYGNMDEHGNMIYSNQDRQKIFERSMPLNCYLDIFSFFLRKSLELI